MATSTLSVRERILRGLVSKIENMQAGQPVDDPYSLTWDVVTRGPIEGIHERQRYALSVLDTEEFGQPEIQCLIARLRVVLEFRVFLDKGEGGSEVVNRVLGDLQRRVREDIYLTEPDGTQLSLNVTETGNQVFVDGFGDLQVGGALFLEILYRRHINDPRRYVGNLQ